MKKKRVKLYTFIVDVLQEGQKEVVEFRVKSKKPVRVFEVLGMLRLVELDVLGCKTFARKTIKDET